MLEGYGIMACQPYGPCRLLGYESFHRHRLNGENPDQDPLVAKGSLPLSRMNAGTKYTCILHSYFSSWLASLWQLGLGFVT
jgi:hypothetical protein